MQAPQITEPEKQPVALSLKGKRTNRISKRCVGIWITAFLSIVYGLAILLLAHYVIPSETLQESTFFAAISAVLGILLTISGIGLWHLKKWGVTLFALAGTILISAFWISFVDALINGSTVKILSNGTLALICSIGLVWLTVQSWRDIEAT